MRNPSFRRDPARPSEDRSRSVDFRRFRPSAPLVCLAMICVGLGACGSEDDVGTDELLDTLIDDSNVRAEEVCDCSAELGYTSRAECIDDFGYLGPSRRRCIKDAYAKDEAASRQYLECVLPLSQELSRCVNERLVCNDFSSIGACLDDYDLGWTNCIGLPASVARELASCSGG